MRRRAMPKPDGAGYVQVTFTGGHQPGVATVTARSGDLSAHVDVTSSTARPTPSRRRRCSPRSPGRRIDLHRRDRHRQRAATPSVTTRCSNCRQRGAGRRQRDVRATAVGPGPKPKEVTVGYNKDLSTSTDCQGRHPGLWQRKPRVTTPTVPTADVESTGRPFAIAAPTPTASASSGVVGPSRTTTTRPTTRAAARTPCTSRVLRTPLRRTSKDASCGDPGRRRAGHDRSRATLPRTWIR